MENENWPWSAGCMMGQNFDARENVAPQRKLPDGSSIPRWHDQQHKNTMCSCPEYTQKQANW